MWATEETLIEWIRSGEVLTECVFLMWTHQGQLSKTHWKLAKPSPYGPALEWTKSSSGLSINVNSIYKDLPLELSAPRCLQPEAPLYKDLLLRPEDSSPHDAHKYTEVLGCFHSWCVSLRVNTKMTQPQLF